MEENVENKNDLFEDIIDSVVLLDKEGKIEKINKAALNLLGYREEELLGEPMSKMCKTLSFKRLIDELPSQNYEMRYLDRWNREIPVSVNITARRDANGEIRNIILIARDISKMKELIDELTISREGLKSSYSALQVSKDKLVHSEKLAFTGRIAASIAHEIRNPLTNVAMSVQEIKKGFKIEDLKAKHVEIAIRNIERINFLITELLNCASPQKLIMRPCDIHGVLEKSLESVKPKIKSKRIRVNKYFTTKPSKFKMDKEHMGRAFLNIFLNAIEAMPEGGELTIATDLHEKVFVVKIQDTGKGIPVEDILKIFDPFFSSKRGGVGLGLTLCYGVVVSHGGTIELESESKKGSTFTISLPVE